MGQQGRGRQGMSASTTAPPGPAAPGDDPCAVFITTNVHFYSDKRAQQHGGDALGGHGGGRVASPGDPGGRPDAQQSRPSLQRLQEVWEVMTATDSDDDDDGEAGGLEGQGGPPHGPAASRLTRASKAEAKAAAPAAAREPALKRRHQADLAGGSAGSVPVLEPRGIEEEDDEEEEDCLDLEGSSSGSGSELLPDDDVDSGDEDFMHAYSSAMASELGSSTVAQSFQRRAGDATRQAGEGGGGQAGEGGGAGPAGEGEGEGELQPVDLDLNLVASLMESYSAQGGRAGPASSIAGMLGLPLPH